jgi:hypothetical protein
MKVKVRTETRKMRNEPIKKNQNTLLSLCPILEVSFRKCKESGTGEPGTMSRRKCLPVQPACAVTRPRQKTPDMLYNPENAEMMRCRCEPQNRAVIKNQKEKLGERAS